MTTASPTGDLTTGTARDVPGPRRGAGPARRTRTRLLILLTATGLLLVLAVLSVMVGARPIAPGTVWDALFRFDSSDEHVMVRELRVPRTVIGLLVGAALGLSGALIQAFTRNPLADPGILGVNAGASLAVTFAVAVLGYTGAGQFIWFALAGAFGLTVLVYTLGSVGADRGSPAKLTLAGVAFTAVCGGFTSAMALKNTTTFDVMRFWGVGSIGGRSLDILPVALPLIGAGLLLGLCSAGSLNALALGDDLARSLGTRLALTRVVLVLAVTLLAGTSVAVAGPIAFVGLMVPHIVRWFVGPDQRWILPVTIIAAPAFLLAADIIGRVVLPSGEMRVGLVTALVGAPVLVALVRRRKVSTL
ncbi:MULTISPECIES: FecCD family ABC transporter permease [unclassified Streptomyces]|uniref:FecCD family ABC transporter permease n=1 Tax=unclassified Streptomyces TaxID=2593676 RepID=UPI00048E8D4D|nr:MULTISPECIES: iron chelate uptake ABC transporter family permease subunit [unclassified Streptomyces]MYY20007.1 iron chelate uptake ABC transporter family permease subunit [Streptomyces sp. SID4912]SCE31137.1 iron complex transport system permease protein [Streptomyces sp. DpondAA-D4]